MRWRGTAGAPRGRTRAARRPPRRRSSASTARLGDARHLRARRRSAGRAGVSTTIPSKMCSRAFSSTPRDRAELRAVAATTGGPALEHLVGDRVAVVAHRRRRWRRRRARDDRGRDAARRARRHRHDRRAGRRRRELRALRGRRAPTTTAQTASSAARDVERRLGRLGGLLGARGSGATWPWRDLSTGGRAALVAALGRLDLAVVVAAELRVPVGPPAGASSVMNDSCAIGMPAYSLIGTRVRFVISSVSVPFQPGSRSRRSRGRSARAARASDLPSMRATMSSGSSTHSSVRPRTNSPGWMTNGSSVVDRDLLGEVRRRIAQVDRRDAVVVEDAERVAEAQVDARGLDQRRIPRLDLDAALLDEAQDRAVGQDGGRRGVMRREVCQRRGGAPLTVSAPACARARPRCARAAARRRRRRRAGRGAGGGGSGGAARGAAARPPSPPSSARRPARASCVIAHQTMYSSSHDRDLEDDHQEDEGPLHRLDATPAPGDPCTPAPSASRPGRAQRAARRRTA